MFRFSLKITEAVDNKLWKTFNVSRGGPFISQLFADDLLFSKANGGQANKIMHIFNEFSCESGSSLMQRRQIKVYIGISNHREPGKLFGDASDT